MMPCTESGSAAPGRAEHPRVLLRVERVAARLLDEPGLHVGGEHGTVEQRAEQPRRLLVGERRERDRLRVQPSPAPRRPPFEQLGPRGAEHEQRDVARPVDQVVDEVERAVVGPVQVLEHEDERVDSAIASNSAPGAERVFATPRAPPSTPTSGRGGREPVAVAPIGSSSRADAASPRSPRACPTRAPRRAPEPPPRRPRRRRRRRRARGPAARGELSSGSLSWKQLPDEPALPDARDADERDELHRAAARTLERVGQQPQLEVAADERRSVVRHVDAEARARRDSLPGGDRIGLAFRRDRSASS